MNARKLTPDVPAASQDTPLQDLRDSGHGGPPVTLPRTVADGPVSCQAPVIFAVQPLSLSTVMAEMFFEA